MASDQLLAGGDAAREALLREIDAPDPEVRAAARRLVTLIEQTGFSRRLAEFAADVDGKRGVTLPGWDRFSELAGGDESARGLFVEMQRAEAPLLRRVFESGLDDSQPIAWEERILRLQNWQLLSRQRELRPPLGSCATMFFLGSLAESNMSETATLYLNQLAQRPPMNEALQPQRGQPAIRRLMAAWLVNCPSQNEDLLSERLRQMFVYELDEALPLPIGIVQNAAENRIVNPNLRIMAIQAVGRFGSAPDALALESLLEDKTEFLPKPPPGDKRRSSYSVQTRDVALATMLNLTGQNLRSYGFMQARRHPQTVFDAHTLGLESDDRRAAAAAQWREWKASHMPETASTR